MNDKLLIPEKVKIGYQERKDTYTKKLAYVIYYDTKGVLRKETSWQSWRNKKIDFDDYENVPTEGFVLNRGVGGQRQSYGWNTRNEYIRVYDPRGFEFEISVANLLFILQECTSSKGKGLEGEFVYSWSGKELVLLPVGSQEYKVSTEFTDLQSNKIGARELKPGCSYQTKDMKNVTYLGRFMYHTTKYEYGTPSYSRYEGKYVTYGKKGHIFHEEVNDYNGTPQNVFTHWKSMGKLAKLNSDVEVSNYADLMDKFNESRHASGAVALIAKPIKVDFDKESTESHGYWQYRTLDTFIDNGDGTYDEVRIDADIAHNSDNRKEIIGYSLNFNYRYSMTPEGVVVKSSDYTDDVDKNFINHPKFNDIEKGIRIESQSHWNNNHKNYFTKDQINSIEFTSLKVKLENGKIGEAKQFSERDY